MARFERDFLGSRRRHLLRGVTGRVLEVGAGTGVNFSYYGPQATVLACEPAPDMLRRAEAKAQASAARIELIEAGINDDSLNAAIAPGSLNAVVCTLVLCTVPDPMGALADFKRWLHPGGQLLVLEHIRPRRAIYRRIFQAIQPLWGLAAEGCQLSRDTGRYIREAGFIPLEEQQFERGLPFLEGIYILAEANEPA